MNFHSKTWNGSGFERNDDVVELEWTQPNYSGVGPGPCNMHTADVVGDLVLVFRGGDGRAYLNDLPALDLNLKDPTDYRI